MNRYWRSISVVVAASLTACGDTDIGTGPGGQSSHQFRWEGSLAPADTLEIRGVNGSIHSKRAPDNGVLITATIRGADEDIADVKVEAVPHANGVTVCARYPDLSGNLIPCLPDSDSRINIRPTNVQVEFTVEVPDGVTFVARTVNGALTAADLHADVIATTVNGDIDLATEGLAEASTVNGSIAVSMGATNWGRTLAFTAVNGSVDVAVPRDVDAWVEGRTLNGRIETDFPLSVTNEGIVWQIHGSLGAGTWDLLMTTVNGDLALMERR